MHVSASSFHLHIPVHTHHLLFAAQLDPVRLDRESVGGEVDALVLKGSRTVSYLRSCYASVHTPSSHRAASATNP